MKVPMLVNMKNREGKRQYSVKNDPLELYIRCIGVEMQYILSISQSYGTCIYIEVQYTTLVKADSQVNAVPSCTVRDGTVR